MLVKHGGHLGLGVAALLVTGGGLLCYLGLRPDKPGPPPQPSSSVLVERGSAERGARRVRALGPSVPTRIDIPAIGVHAPVVPLGLEPNGTIAVPPLNRIHETSWYKYGPTPGEDGPAVIVGHVDSKTRPGVFYKLGGIKPGSRIQISRKDGTRPTFQIYRLERIAKRNFPTQQVYGPVRHPALRLITCGGKFDRASGHYTDNLVAYAVRIF